MMRNILEPSARDKTGLAIQFLPVLLHSLVLLAGLYILFWPMISSGFAQLQDNPGDTLLNHYILEHTWACISQADYIGDFWNPPFYYPARNVLAYSETLIGVAPVYWFFRLFLADIHAYQAWIFTMAGGTYLSTIWAMRRMHISHLAAATGAFLFSFGIIRSNQIGHQQLLCQIFTAPALAFLWSYLQHGKTTHFLGLTVCAALQILACIYLGWFTAFAMVLFSAIVLTLDGRSRTTVLDHVRKNSVTSLLIVSAALTCLAPIFAMYLIVNHDAPRPLSECILYAPHLSSWLAPPPGWIAWPTMSRFTHQQHCMETYLFFGFMPHLLVLSSIIALTFNPKGILPSSRQLMICALASIAFLVAITLVSRGCTLWSIIYHLVPGAKAIRVVARIWTVAFLFFVIVGAVGWDHCLRHRIVSPWIRQTAGMAVLAICMIEQIRIDLPSFMAEPFYQKATRLAEKMTGASMVYVRPSISSHESNETSHICAMWAGLKANVRVINGYSGRLPTAYPNPGQPWSTIELAKWLGDCENPDNVRIFSHD